MIIKVALPIALKREFDYLVPKSLESKIKPGIRIKVPFGYRQLTGFVTKIETKYRKPGNITLKEINSLVDEISFYGSELLPLSSFISSRWGTPLGLVLSALVPDYIKPNKRLPQHPPTMPEIPRNNIGKPMPYGNISALSLQGKTGEKSNNEQKRAADTILTAVKNRETKTFLLFYNPFTDTKNIHLEILKEVLTKKSQGLIIMPDIAATASFAKEMKEMFGQDSFALWHSKISRVEKNKIYHRLSSGESMIVLGTRSASMLAFKNLAAAIIAHEQDDMYKQEENKPYYHARAMLLYRSKQNGFPLVLSSSTPSLETLRDAVDKKIEFIKIADDTEIAKPEIIITSRYGGHCKLISDELFEKLKGTFAAGSRALIILNRRGIENSYVCHNCGWLCECDKCCVEMFNHKGELHCLKCKDKKSLPEECPKCRNRIFKTVSYGIKKAKQEFKKLFPQIKIEEFDAGMINEEADLIIGTRFVMRGYKFKKLGCVAFLNIDTERAVIDFRASEKIARMIFQALAYLVNDNTALIIQTSKKDDLVFKSIKKRDYLDFAFRELETRKELKYPPHCKLIRVILTAKELKIIEKNARKIISALRKKSAENGYKPDVDFEILGPASFGFKHKSNVLKYHLIIKYYNPLFIGYFWQTADKIKVKKPASLKIIVDPVDFY